MWVLLLVKVACKSNSILSRRSGLPFAAVMHARLGVRKFKSLKRTRDPGLSLEEKQRPAAKEGCDLGVPVLAKAVLLDLLLPRSSWRMPLDSCPRSIDAHCPNCRQSSASQQQQLRKHLLQQLPRLPPSLLACLLPCLPRLTLPPSAWVPMHDLVASPAFQIWLRSPTNSRWAMAILDLLWLQAALQAFCASALKHLTLSICP